MLSPVLMLQQLPASNCRFTSRPVRSPNVCLLSPAVCAHHRPGNFAFKRQSVRKPLPPAPAASSDKAPDTPPQGGMLGGLYKSLRDFGLGRKSITEAAIGLFVIAGAGLAISLIQWARGNALRTGDPYQATIEFPQACGITVGTPVRIRGVQIGSVLDVKPSLDRVDVLVEINDKTSVIPRNSIIEANQSGLIAEPLVDITPQLPIPTFTASPLDPSCSEEGKIVCSNGHIQGRPGVAMDDLVYICTKLARQMDKEGISTIFAAAEAATAAINEATPLLKEANALVEELTPLLAELREGGLANNIDSLTHAAAEAASNIQKLQTAVLDDENVQALKGSVITLTKTLEHIESLTGDLSVFAHDPATHRNLKTLVQALSRLIED